MTTVTVEEAKLKLAELIELLRAGDEILITVESTPVAKLVRAEEPRKPGALRGSVVYMAPDFDDPIEDFEFDEDDR
jgi:prevent-host-death family protein